MLFYLPLFLGFFIAFLAVIPPGLINMTAAKISLQEGKNEAISFALGASVIIFDSRVKGKSNRFFLGMLLSTLNLLPIPFYVFASMTLAASGYFSFDKIPVAEFVIGVMIGSFTVFYIYIVAFKKIENKTEFLMRNINTIIGSVTTFMAVLTLFKLLYK